MQFTSTGVEIEFNVNENTTHKRSFSKAKTAGGRYTIAGAVG